MASFTYMDSVRVKEKRNTNKAYTHKRIADCSVRTDCRKKRHKQIQMSKTGEKKNKQIESRIRPKE